MSTHTDSKITVAVLFGGRSGEHEVSLMSARSVLSVLDPQKYTVLPVGITHSGTWVTGANVLDAMEQGKTDTLIPVTLLPSPNGATLFALSGSPEQTIMRRMAHVDVVFPVLHGTFGEDGTLQGLLELAECAYVGAGVLGSSVGMDKALFKDVMRANGIPVLESVLVLRAEIESDMEAAIAKVETLGAYPFFVKPANMGSSVGVTKCRSRADLMEGLMDAAQYDRRILVERAAHNPREIEISVLGNDDAQASVPGEIVPGADFYSYDAKYVLDNSQLIIPAALTEQQSAQLRDIAVRAYKAIDASGMARVDFLLDTSSGEIYLNEINTIPGFTKISMYPKLWEASGMPYPTLVDNLIQLAVKRYAERARTIQEYRRQA